MRISERKRTTRTPDTSKSASRNTETQSSNQRSLLEGGVGSFRAAVSGLSLNVAIRSEWGNNLIIPLGFAPNSNLGRSGYQFSHRRDAFLTLVSGQPPPIRWRRSHGKVAGSSRTQTAQPPPGHCGGSTGVLP